MADDAPGEGLAARLMARGGAGLHRRSMPDGGEVYSGPVAQRALRALGARAFTMDDTIFVDNDFDPSNNAEHAALYAHEDLHRRHSGGKDEHSERDEEEIEARRVERMVFHRASAGEDLGSIMRSLKDGTADAPTGDGGGGGGGGGESEGVTGEDGQKRDPMEGYKALKSEGRQHYMIVRELAQFCVDKVMDMNESHAFRTTAHDFF